MVDQNKTPLFIYSWIVEKYNVIFHRTLIIQDVLNKFIELIFTITSAKYLSESRIDVHLKTFYQTLSYFDRKYNTITFLYAEIWPTYDSSKQLFDHEHLWAGRISHEALGKNKTFVPKVNTKLFIKYFNVILDIKICLIRWFSLMCYLHLRKLWLLQ